MQTIVEIIPSIYLSDMTSGLNLDSEAQIHFFFYFLFFNNYLFIEGLKNYFVALDKNMFVTSYHDKDTPYEISIDI